MKPVIIELTDFKTKEKVDELEVDACMVATGRAPFTQVRSGPSTNPGLDSNTDPISTRIQWHTCLDLVRVTSRCEAGCLNEWPSSPTC